MGDGGGGVGGGGSDGGGVSGMFGCLGSAGGGGGGGGGGCGGGGGGASGDASTRGVMVTVRPSFDTSMPSKSEIGSRSRPPVPPALTAELTAPGGGGGRRSVALKSHWSMKAALHSRRGECARVSKGGVRGGRGHREQAGGRAAGGMG